MSRAIIARRIKNGFFSSWCWVNSGPENTGEILRKYFTSDEDVDELISMKSILGIYKDPADDTNTKIAGSFSQLKNGLYVKYDDGKHQVVSGGLNGFFPAVSMMLRENVQYVYIFDEGEWVVYVRQDNDTDKPEIKETGQNNTEENDEEQSRF